LQTYLQDEQFSKNFGASTACFLLCRRCHLQFHLGHFSISGQLTVGRKKWG